MASIERWAAGVSWPTYAIDVETALKVSHGEVEVVSEGRGALFSSEEAA